MPGFAGSRHEQLELFREFAEDFNTVTMPHEKYYDLEKWEMQEYERKKRGEASNGGVRTTFDDEREREAEMRRERDARDRAAEAAELRATGRSLLDDGAADDVRQQQLLLAEQQHAYKRGDLETVRRIQRKLDAIGRDDGQKEFRPAGWG
mmetsp:Transcript_29008/g.89690  ORF Transcript_29008/g.89690 Transcript_29008/m.89690 type:complete len:150 (+) Transcript_29008:650-1099(+)